MKTTIATGLAIVAVASALGNAAYAHRVSADLGSFKRNICALQTANTQFAAHFDKLLRTLERRALIREEIDKRNHSFTQAAADSDAARLYASVLPARGARQPPPLC